MPATRAYIFPALLLVSALTGCVALTQPDGEPRSDRRRLVPAEAPAPLVAPASPSAGGAASAVASAAPPAPPPPAAPPPSEKVRASHILVSWKGSARSTQKRTKEEARKRIDTVLARARKGEDFAKLAAEFGEDGTKNSGGDLGEFARTDMVAPFSEAAFALKPGQLSNVVETQFGFHLIKRTK